MNAYIFEVRLEQELKIIGDKLIAGQYASALALVLALQRALVQVHSK